MSKLLQKIYHMRPAPSSLAGKTHTVTPPGHSSPDSSGPVHIVELFQSQGCNSCPPTNDALLDIIPRRSDVLVLTYEVTYWDYIGWKDVFGNKNFDDRQREYARRWLTTRVYTPQVIVNGRREAEGSGRVKQLIDQGIRAQQHTATDSPVSIALEGSEVVVVGANAGRADVVAVIYDPNLHEVPVTRGENRGETLRHQNVVRSFGNIGSWTGGKQRFQVPKLDEGLRVAILVQDGKGGNVLAALRCEKTVANNIVGLFNCVRRQEVLCDMLFLDMRDLRKRAHWESNNVGELVIPVEMIDEGLYFSCLKDSLLLNKMSNDRHLNSSA